MVSFCSSVPKAEIRQAKAAIDAAESVDAGRYAQAELTAAKAHFGEAQGHVKKDNKKAKQQAINAKRNADAAYFKSIAQFTSDGKKDVEINKNSATTAHADKASPALYQKAMSHYNSLQNNLKRVEQLKAELTALEKAGEKK